MAEAGELCHWEIVERMARSAGEADVRELAESVLPVQREHIETVRRRSPWPGGQRGRGCGGPANRGRPSSHGTSQGAGAAAKEWKPIVIPGSSSSVPRRTDTSGPSGHEPPKRLDPHTRQNTLANPPPGGRKASSSGRGSRGGTAR